MDYFSFSCSSISIWIRMSYFLSIGILLIDNVNARSIAARRGASWTRVRWACRSIVAIHPLERRPFSFDLTRMVLTSYSALVFCCIDCSQSSKVLSDCASEIANAMIYIANLQ